MNGMNKMDRIYADKKICIICENQDNLCHLRAKLNNTNTKESNINKK
jgi:hypothetical protein